VLATEKPKGTTRMRKLLLAFSLLFASLTAHAAGFDGLFTARTGDLNGDGRTDLYLKWTPKIAMIDLGDLSVPIPTSRRPMADFVLQQTSTGAFTVLATLSGAQMTTVAQWPRVSNSVQLVPGDVNYDGALDLIVRNLTAAISGVEANQVIIASVAAGAGPLDVKALTSDMRSFYDQVTRWFMAPEVTDVYYELIWNYYGFRYTYDPIFCDAFVQCLIHYDDANDPDGTWPGDDPYSPNVYHYFGATLYSWSVTYHQYNFTDTTAYNFADPFYDIEHTGKIVPGAATTTAMQTILNGLWAGHDYVNLTQQPNGGVEGGVKDDWNWVQIIEHLSRIFYEVCIASGAEDARQCYRDIVNPGSNQPAICGLNVGPVRIPNPLLNYAITPTQRSMDASNQRRPFWVSREQDSCDPFAPAALGVVDEKGLGRVTMQWLRTVAAHVGVTINEQQLGYDIMHGHRQATDEDHVSIDALLSPTQISDYHQRVFRAHGLPDYTFGGAPFGNDSAPGKIWQDVTGALVWCPGCDIRP